MKPRVACHARECLTAIAAKVTHKLGYCKTNAFKYLLNFVPWLSHAKLCRQING